MRIITDDLYAALIAHFVKDEKVSLFQKLLLSKSMEQGDTSPSGTPGSDDEGEA